MRDHRANQSSRRPVRPSRTGPKSGSTADSDNCLTPVGVIGWSTAPPMCSPADWTSPHTLRDSFALASPRTTPRRPICERVNRNVPSARPGNQISSATATASSALFAARVASTGTPQASSNAAASSSSSQPPRGCSPVATPQWRGPCCHRRAVDSSLEEESSDATRRSDRLIESGAAVRRRKLATNERRRHTHR